MLIGCYSAITSLLTMVTAIGKAPVARRFDDMMPFVDGLSLA